MVLQQSCTVLMSTMYTNLNVHQQDDLRSTFSPRGPGWNWPADAATTWWLPLETHRAGLSAPPHHHSSGLCFVVS